MFSRTRGQTVCTLSPERDGCTYSDLPPNISDLEKDHRIWVLEPLPKDSGAYGISARTIGVLVQELFDNIQEFIRLIQFEHWRGFNGRHLQYLPLGLLTFIPRVSHESAWGIFFSDAYEVEPSISALFCFLCS